MTICIGMVGRDGIVIAADSEEGDTYFKRPQQKIMTWTSLNLSSNGASPGGSACVLAGAGDAGFIDAFTDHLLFSIPASPHMRTFEDHVRERLDSFYTKHVLPAVAVDRNADFQMLIGAYCGWETALYVTYKSTLRRGMVSEAVGIGSSFAMNAMESLSVGNSVRELEVLAAGIISDTKQCIEGCGKHTDIVSIHKSSMVEATEETPCHLEHPPQILTRVPSAQIRRWEESFGTKWAPQQQALMQKLVHEEIAEDDLMWSGARMLEGQQ